MIKVGSKVQLDSIYGELKRSTPDGKVSLVVHNGAGGVILRTERSGAAIVGFDDLGGVEVAVPLHWLKASAKAAGKA